MSFMPLDTKNSDVQLSLVLGTHGLHQHKPQRRPRRAPRCSALGLCPIARLDRSVQLLGKSKEGAGFQSPEGEET